MEHLNVSETLLGLGGAQKLIVNDLNPLRIPLPFAYCQDLSYLKFFTC